MVRKVQINVQQLPAKLLVQPFAERRKVLVAAQKVAHHLAAWF
jgi:hypothetical protein